jgi:hypothetical protein
LPTFGFRRFELIDEWMESASVEQRSAMQKWINALPNGPTELANGSFKKKDGRSFTNYWAVVPGTGAIVTYTVHLYPFRIVTFISVIPEPES